MKTREIPEREQCHLPGCRKSRRIGCFVGQPLADLKFKIYPCRCGQFYVPSAGIFKTRNRAQYAISRYRNAFGYRQRQRIMGRDGGACVHCGAEALLQVHHIVSLLDFGSHDDDNVATLCDPCHWNNHRNKLEQHTPSVER